MAWWIFQNLVITTVFAAAVALACRVGRIGPVARHALWVLVLVKFITPPLLVWPWAAPDPFRLAPAVSRTAPAPIALEAMGDVPQVVALDNSVVAGPSTSSPPQLSVSSASEPAPIWPWLVGLWIFGGVGLLAIEAARLVRLGRRISRHPVAPAIAARVKDLSATLGIRPVPAVMLADITSPVVWAWGRPRILWPSNLGATSDACVDGILLHELAHIKRRDHLVGWIELAAGVVWWWNPLFWSVRSALREQAELACDAWVISALPNGRRAYAESLLALSGETLLNPSMAAVGILPTSRRVLERRLVMIMKGRTALQLPGLGMCCLAIVAAATLPAWASAPQQPPPTPPPVPAAVKPQGPAPSPVQKTPVPKVVRKDDLVRDQATPKVAPLPVPVFRTVQARGTYTVHLKSATNLPADGKELLERYEADHKAIQDEVNQKLEARRAAAVKELEALQEKYTKEGKLDEAVAIRDFLRAGGPGPGIRYTYAIKREP